MSIPGISISLAEVSNAAQTMRNINSELTLKLEAIKKEMDALQSTWQSDAGEAIRQKMQAHSARFEEYRQVVDSYVEFLNLAVAEYDSTETTLHNNANAFN